MFGIPVLRKKSQDTRKIKETSKDKDILTRKKNMITNQIVILNQVMRLKPIINLMIRKASIPEITSYLKILKQWSIYREYNTTNLMWTIKKIP